MARYNWGATYTPEINMDSPGVSKYNSAQLINQRMHDLWMDCKRAWKNGDLNQLNDVLDVVYTELYSDASKDHKIRLKKFDADIIKLKMQLVYCKTGRELMLAKTKYALEIKYKWLFLKTLEKKQGIGKAYRDEFEDDFE